MDFNRYQDSLTDWINENATFEDFTSEARRLLDRICFRFDKHNCRFESHFWDVNTARTTLTVNIVQPQNNSEVFLCKQFGQMARKEVKYISKDTENT